MLFRKQKKPLKYTTKTTFFIKMTENTTKKSLKKRLFHKQTIVLRDDDTLKERFSLRLNLMNVFVLVSVFSIVMFTLTVYVIAFTSLREYIPGYSSAKVDTKMMELIVKTDSIERVLYYNKAYLESVRKVLLGEIKPQKASKDSIIHAELSKIENRKFLPSKADSLLRNEVANEDKYNLFEKAEQKVSTVLFAPVKGTITSGFSEKDKHLAVDIALPIGTPIKSIANGTIIFADWTPTNGNVIIISHHEEIMSVYKHCESIIKTQGDLVKTGEVVATSGNTGTLSTGAHLHFELWKNGYFIEFE